MSDRRLTKKQARFVEEYLVDYNATQAAFRSGYSEKMSGRIGYQLLEKTRIQEAIQAAQKERSERLGINADRVVQELAIIGFADLASYVEWSNKGVTLKDSASLDEMQRRAIVEVSETSFGVRVKLADKKGALDSLGKHLGLFVDRKELTGKGGGPIETKSIPEDLTDEQLAAIAAGGID